uniref:Uncharacterized protein n=1 Tax=Globisporangium ultimum (strain ATCC 200006 / CBS 805.95 / DAOM BR144) TaxID=431595 RepID=K3WJ12_GLOUD
MPLPSSVDIEKILKMHEQNLSWSEITAAINEARPYQLTHAGYPVIIGTGDEFTKVGIAKLLRSFASDTSNPVLAELFESESVGQLTKLRHGNLKLMVTSSEAQAKLRNQVLTILGKEFRVLDRNVLEGHFFIDVPSDFAFDGLLLALGKIGAPVSYSSFREVARGSFTTGAFRVYFATKKYCESLIVNGAPCDQLMFDNRLHLARVKDLPPSAVSIPFEKRSNHLLDLSQ